MVAVARANGRTVQVVKLKASQPSLELQQAICGGESSGNDGGGAAGDPSLPLLLLPAGYAMVNEEDTPALLAELLLVRTCPKSRPVSLLASLLGMHGLSRMIGPRSFCISAISSSLSQWLSRAVLGAESSAQIGPAVFVNHVGDPKP